MVLRDEARERLADDEADVERQAGILSNRPARALERDDVVRFAHHDVARRGVRDDLLEVPQLHRRVQRDELLRGVGRNDLPVVPIGEAPFRSLGAFAVPRSEKQPSGGAHQRREGPRQPTLAGRKADVEVRPPPVHVAVEKVGERVSPRPSPLAPQRPAPGSDDPAAPNPHRSCLPLCRVDRGSP